MMPILFDAAATTFTSNGIGRLDAISCEVTEELNGVYELELTYPVDGKYFSELTVSNIIAAIPHDNGNIQAFRIYKVGKAMNGRVTISARHISYQANWIPVFPFNYSSLADCLSKLKSNSVSTNPFTLWTNKTVSSGGAFTEPLPFRKALGGVQGSVLQRYGGDYEWDNYTIKLWNRRGADNGVRIAYGKNLIDAKQETNIENTYTGVCPYYQDDDVTVTLPEKYILASTSSGFPFLRISTIDFSSDFDEPPTVAQLRQRTEQYINANNIGHPNVNISVSFVALWQTEEYKAIAPLEHVQLGDTVTVYFEKLGIEEDARVISYTYDVLKERYKKINIGDKKSSFSSTFVDQGKAIETSLDESKAYTGKAVSAAKAYSTSYTDSEVDQAITLANQNAQALVTNATSWLTSGRGYVVANKNSDGSWKELLFMDTPSTATAVKVLRINENGIGFSRNGVNGSYKQAWTLDGKLVVGGTNAVTISAINGNNPAQEIFNVDKDGISWLASNSIMTKNGTIYFLANGATASSGNVIRINSSGIGFSRNGYNGSYTQAWDMNGRLSVGGSDVVTIRAVNASNNEIFNVNKSGISWTMAQSIMQKNGTLYFLGAGATATSGHVMRLNNGGIAFSKNGYNGTYNQSWSINGQLTLGGNNNKYGSLTILDSSNRIGADLSDGAIELHYYGTDREEENDIDGDGMNIYSVADSTISAMYTLSGMEVYEGRNASATLDSSGLSLMNDGDYTFANGAEVNTPLVTAEKVEATEINGADYYANGTQGISGVYTLGDGTELTIECGLITDVQEGQAPAQGIDWVHIGGGDHMTFENGLLVDAYDT